MRCLYSTSTAPLVYTVPWTIIHQLCMMSLGTSPTLIGSFSHDSASFEYIGQSPQYLQGLCCPHSTPPPRFQLPPSLPMSETGERTSVLSSCHPPSPHPVMSSVDTEAQAQGRPWPREVRKSHGLLRPHHIKIWGASLAPVLPRPPALSPASICTARTKCSRLSSG